MGIYKQPNQWQCGPFALKHALLMRGVLASEWEIDRLAGTTTDGTDETDLAEAARHFDCELPTIRKIEAAEARAELVTQLRAGFPCLLCIDGWGHWVTAVHEEKGKFIVLDSERPEVIAVLPWRQLRDLWSYREQDDGVVHTLYDLHPLISKGRPRTRARFTLERARQLSRPANRRLAQLWDLYVEDLIAICRARSRGGGKSVGLAEFLRRHTEMIVDQLESWHGKVGREAATEVLDRMRFVAETYGLSIRQSEAKRTVSAVSMILALWAAGEFGIAPLYRTVPVRKLR